MASEITLTVSGTLANGAHKETFNPGAIKIDQAAIGAHPPVVIVGTSEEDLPVGDVVTPGLLFLQNLDTVNFVTYGPKTGGTMAAFGKLKALEVGVLRLDPSTTLRWKADTGPVKVKALLLEN